MGVLGGYFFLFSSSLNKQAANAYGKNHVDMIFFTDRNAV